MSDSFYNTIDLEGKDLEEAENAALSQEQLILRWFIKQGDSFRCGPSSIHDRVFGKSIPLTSVRRALTSLKIRRDLVKSPAMIIGTYGKPEHLWHVSAKWNTRTPRQGVLL